MNLKDFYCDYYPEDELGFDINDKANFTGLLNKLHIKQDIYNYIGVSDSLIRERLFLKLSEIIDVSYDYIYNLWLKSYDTLDY
jgi:hypothetical protein